MPDHSTLTDPDLHEPKGVSSASANTVYVADGAGSGEWQQADSSVVDYAEILGQIQTDIDSGDLDLTGKYFLTAVIPDVSTAGFVLVPVPLAATLTKARLVLAGPITVADAAVSFKNAAGASMGTAVTVLFTASAKGDSYTFTPSGNNVFVAGGWLEIATDGGSTDPQPLTVVLEFSGILNG